MSEILKFKKEKFCELEFYKIRLEGYLDQVSDKSDPYNQLGPIIQQKKKTKMLLYSIMFYLVSRARARNGWGPSARKHIVHLRLQVPTWL